MSLARRGLGLAGIRAINAALGFGLNIALAAVFGVGREVDALFVAMAVSVIMARELSVVIRTAAVPCLVECQERGDAAGFRESYHTIAPALAVAVSLLVAVAAPVVVAIMAPGFDRAAKDEATSCLLVLVPSLAALLLVGHIQGLFHAKRMFVIPEIGETLWRIVAVGGLFAVGKRHGVAAYAAVMSLAAVVQLAVMVVIARRLGIPTVPEKFRMRAGALRAFWVGAATVLCAVVQVQIESMVDRAVLSAVPGAIALFYYAQRLALMVPVLFTGSLLAPWLPEIAKIRARASDPRRLAKQGSLFLAGLGVLVALVLVWAADGMVAFLLVRGRFDAASASTVARAVQILALGIPAIFCNQCLIGLYIVERDFRAMLRLSMTIIVVHLAGNLLLRHMGVVGIAISCTFSVWCAAILLWRRIRSVEQVWFPWIRFAAAVAAVSATLFAVPWSLMMPQPPFDAIAGAVAAWVVYNAIMGPAIARMRAYENQATGV